MPFSRMLLSLYFCFSVCFQIGKAQQVFDYPKAKHLEHTDTIFGAIIEDPYRWMEQPDHELWEWLEIQADILDHYKRKTLKQFKRAEYTLRRYTFARFDALQKNGDDYYFYKYNNYNKAASLYRKTSYYSNEFLVADPSKFEENGDQVSIRGHELSKDGTYLALSLSRSGSDWQEIRVKRKGDFLDDVLKWVKYSGIYWKGDGFYYWRYEPPKKGRELLAIVKNQQLCYHKVGTSQEEDDIIYQIDETAYGNSTCAVSTDEKYLFLYTAKKKDGKWKKLVQYKNLEVKGDFKTLLTYPDNKTSYDIIDHIDGKVYFISDFNAPNRRILSIDLETGRYTQIIPEYDELLQQIHIIDHKLVCLYYNKGKYILAVFDLEGNLVTTKKFDEGQYVSGFSGSINDEETLFYVQSFFVPPIVYKMNFKDTSTELLSKTKILYDHKKFETNYVKYKSTDGTEVGMYLTHKKDLDLESGNNPVLLYGYGGFGIVLKPHFKPGYVMFLDNGGVLATPQIRGGGEFGQAWHDAGRKLNKQKSYDDFIAAAEYLIENKITNAEKIAINGGSNGGLLVGSVLTQKPELYKVAVAEMGVFDMLRYDQFGIGYVHHKEFGDPADSTHFFNLLSYSPYHNVAGDKTYPATLLITADHDDRVPPLHSYKFLARLQETSSNTPFLLDLQLKSGHYGASTLSDRISHNALKWSFIFEHLDMKAK